MIFTLFIGSLVVGFFSGFGLHSFIIFLLSNKTGYGRISLNTLKKILNYEDLERSEFIQSSRRSLTLAGFTLSSISLLIGTYQNNLKEISGMLIPLFVAIFLFFLSSKFALEAQVFWEGLLAEALEYGGEFYIIFALRTFLLNEVSLISISWLPIITAIIIAVFVIRSFVNLIYMYSHMKKREVKRNEQASS